MIRRRQSAPCVSLMLVLAAFVVSVGVRPPLAKLVIYEQWPLLLCVSQVHSLMCQGANQARPPCWSLQAGPNGPVNPAV